MVSLGLTPSDVSNSTVVCALCEAGYVELALDYVRKSRNTPPGDFNVYCYNPIIRGFCHTGKVDEALELLEEMKRCSVSPDVYRALVEVKIYACKNLNAVLSLRALELVQDRIERLHIDCVWNGLQES